MVPCSSVWRLLLLSSGFYLTSRGQKASHENKYVVVCTLKGNVIWPRSNESQKTKTKKTCAIDFQPHVSLLSSQVSFPLDTKLSEGRALCSSVVSPAPSIGTHKA